MNAKTRIKQLEKERGGKVKTTWKDFIAWANGDKTIDVNIVAQIEKAWTELLGNDVQ